MYLLKVSLAILHYLSLHCCYVLLHFGQLFRYHWAVVIMPFPASREGLTQVRLLHFNIQHMYPVL